VNAGDLVGLIRAQSHHPGPVSQLLKLGHAWPAGLPDKTTPAKPCRVFRQLTSGEIDGLVEQYRAGRTVFELAEAFGIHRVTVGQHLRARGIDTKPPAMRDEDVPEAASLYKEGWSLARLAQRFGTTSKSVQTRLLAAGVTMRPRQGGRKRAALSREYAPSR
jgi:DNA-binding transcriptional ArsR family regulator